MDAPVEFDPADIIPRSNIVSDVLLVKLKGEISVILSNASIKVHFRCEKCLKEYDATITIPSTEREFLSEQPEKIPDLDDVFLIDMKETSINLHEMLRQEIILHFPLISVCSKSCKGLCEQCGTDLNRNTCGCVKEDPSHYRPFRNLKDILS